VLIWLLQTVFLSSFYESMKTKTIEDAAAQIAESYGQADFAQVVDRQAYKNSILIYVTDTEGNLLYTSDEHGPGGNGPRGNAAFGNAPGGNLNGPGNGGGIGGPPNGFNGQRSLPQDYGEFLARLSESGKDSISYTINQDNFSGNTLIYGQKLGDTILYISTPIEPLDATIGILRTQLVYITLLTLIAGFVIAYFISKKMSEPITNITKTAGRLAEGDYDVQFEKGYYSEVDALAGTLNYTAHELSKVEALRRELIANISHDLRTPLTMIKGYTEMIEEVSGDDPEVRARHLSIIKEETARLEGLVGDVLDLSVLQSGNEGIHPENINVSEIIRNVLSRFETLSEQDGYRFEPCIAHDQYVFADKTRIEQVLYNLIGNAINYAGADKTIGVRLADLGSFVRFEVTDHGSGIAEEDLPYIWDRYYKSEEQPRAKVGTGIGLSIVKNVLSMHGAKFGVVSQAGQGSTFWFELNK
ncbi:MAG: HAMP domain-containing histidine kinase, partial [Clostridiales Family XIII bacterium]|jgi:signal transduction histidine kinase|nr:HAMP domain-containing histidine kinase [Clostridiales Family XIII bacterium]